MSTIDEKRAAFHQYLATSGVISALSKALIKLYEEPNKPDDPVNFVRRHMGSEDFFILGDRKSAKDENAEEELILNSLVEKKSAETVVGNDEVENAGEVAASTEEITDVVTEEVTAEVAAEVAEVVTEEVTAEKDKHTVDDGIVEVEVEVKSNESDLDQLNTGFENLKSNSDCNSLLKAHLNDEIFDKLKDVQSDGGASLFECIKSGLENPNAVVGIYAIDHQSYDKFSEIFDPVIEAYHGFGKENVQPQSDWGDPSAFETFDGNNDVVVSLRITCARNLLQYPFVCKMLEHDLNESFAKIKTIIDSSNVLSNGTFYTLTDLTEDQETELRSSGALMENSNPNLTSINVYQQWPLGRGVFVSESTMVQVNSEDHLKFISTGNDLGTTYQQLVDTVNLFELTFARHDRLGWLTLSPSNLGTGLNISAELKLSKLYSNPEKLQEIIKVHSMLQVKPSDTEAETIFTLYNQSTIGLSEFGLVKQFYDAIRGIIECERCEE